MVATAFRRKLQIESDLPVPTRREVVEFLPLPFGNEAPTVGIVELPAYREFVGGEPRLARVIQQPACHLQPAAVRIRGNLRTLPLHTHAPPPEYSQSG